MLGSTHVASGCAKPQYLHPCLYPGNANAATWELLHATYKQLGGATQEDTEAAFAYLLFPPWSTVASRVGAGVSRTVHVPCKVAASVRCAACHKAPEAQGLCARMCMNVCVHVCACVASSGASEGWLHL